jgi:hypothetical protein
VLLALEQLRHAPTLHRRFSVIALVLHDLLSDRGSGRAGWMTPVPPTGPFTEP